MTQEQYQKVLKGYWKSKHKRSNQERTKNKAKIPMMPKTGKNMKRKYFGPEYDSSQTHLGPKHQRPGTLGPVHSRLGPPVQWGPRAMGPWDTRTTGTQGPMANSDPRTMGCPEHLDPWHTALWLAGRNLVRILQQKFRFPI